MLAVLYAGCSTHSAKKPSHSGPGQNHPSRSAVGGAKVFREGRLLRLDYEAYTLWLDCSLRAAVRFRYLTKSDTGNQGRSGSYRLDPEVPRECQQTRVAGYGDEYDRGHLVPANHLDYSGSAIRQTNFMTNILPQTAELNRGAWLRTEQIIECYRNVDTLTVLGGAIWGKPLEKNPLIESHQIRVPLSFWKVVIRGNGNAIGWIIPNSEEARAAMLDQYQTGMDTIEQLTGVTLPVGAGSRDQGTLSGWLVPAGCDRR